MKRTFLTVMLALTFATAARAQAPAEAPEPEAPPAAAAPPAPAPAPLEEDEEPATAPAPPPPPKQAAAKPKAEAPENNNGGTVGLNPALPQYGDEVTTRPRDLPLVGTGGLEVHGYLRAPLRVGVGTKNDGSSGQELHSPPHIPDGSFTDWRYLDLLPGPWAEIMFSYGNPRAKGTVSIASYNQTIASYRDLQSQLGINQAFVTLNFPGSVGPNGDLSLTVGSFSNRYGTAGKYDAGKYETYLFGRTRAAGETLSFKYQLTPSLALYLEHGVGAKLDVVPFGTVATTDPTLDRPEYLPYSGPEPQGSTFLHHAHAGVGFGKVLRVNAHYLTSFTPDDRSALLPAGSTAMQGYTGSHSGRMSIYGGEARFSGGVFGDGYLGYSRVDARHILPLADAIEVLHSSGGWQFKNNYFGGFDPRTRTKPPDDSGTVDTVLFQYALSFGKIARYPTRFSGQGPDLTLTLFGMFNSVSSETQSHDKLKYGADLFYSAFEALAFGARYDLVQPNLNDNDQSFSVLSPSIVLRTAFVARERVTLQYSRYFLGDEAYPSFPYELTEADKDVIMISGSMFF